MCHCWIVFTDLALAWGDESESRLRWCDSCPKRRHLMTGEARVSGRFFLKGTTKRPCKPCFLGTSDLDKHISQLDIPGWRFKLSCLLLLSPGKRAQTQAVHPATAWTKHSGSDLERIASSELETAVIQLQKQWNKSAGYIQDQRKITPVRNSEKRTWWSKQWRTSSVIKRVGRHHVAASRLWLMARWSRTRKTQVKEGTADAKRCPICLESEVDGVQVWNPKKIWKWHEMAMIDHLTTPFCQADGIRSLCFRWSCHANTRFAATVWWTMWKVWWTVGRWQPNSWHAPCQTVGKLFRPMPFRLSCKARMERPLSFDCNPSLVILW